MSSEDVLLKMIPITASTGWRNVDIVRGVPQGSVLDPLKLYLYLLPLGAILKYHGIGYHIHADDTQLYILFKCNNPLTSLPKLKNCIYDMLMMCLDQDQD